MRTSSRRQSSWGEMYANQLWRCQRSPWEDGEEECEPAHFDVTGRVYLNGEDGVGLCQINMYGLRAQISILL